MKRYIRSNQSTELQISLQFRLVSRAQSNLQDVDDQIAASEQIHIEPRPNIDPNVQIPEELLAVYQKIVNEVNTILFYEYEFYKLDRYQSSTYSYYFNFYPVDLDNKVIRNEIEVQLKISNHRGQGDEGTVNPSLYRIVYIVDDEIFKDSEDFLWKIRATCANLSQGDYTQIE